MEMLLKQMRQAGLEDSLFDNDRSRFYREMHDHQLSLHLAERGSVGIADLIVRQLGKAEPSSTNGRTLEGYRNRPVRHQPVSKGAPGSVGARDGHHPPPRDKFTASSEGTPPLAPPERFETPQEFIHTLWPEARRAAARIGVDPKLLLAQAALETGWGKKVIRHSDGRSSHNLFNIKAGRGWKGERTHVTTLEYLGGVAVKKRDAFRAYDDYRQSFEDYIRLLHKPRYAKALDRTGDPEGYLKALQEAGYATDPAYADKILNIYRRQTLAAL